MGSQLHRLKAEFTPSPFHMRDGQGTNSQRVPLAMGFSVGVPSRMRDQCHQGKRIVLLFCLGAPRSRDGATATTVTGEPHSEGPKVRVHTSVGQRPRDRWPNYP